MSLKKILRFWHFQIKGDKGEINMGLDDRDYMSDEKPIKNRTKNPKNIKGYTSEQPNSTGYVLTPLKNLKSVEDAPKVKKPWWKFW